jgi:Cu/Ag efflux protein CusF
VIKAIDRASGRTTIAYEAVDELNWPRGTMPFPVAEESVMTGAAVGEKVRFKVDSHEIYEMRPY